MYSNSLAPLPRREGAFRYAERESICSLCERAVPAHLITQHHLKPKVKGGKADDRTPMCRPCHKQVHAVFSNVELARDYTTLELLKNSSRLDTFLKWIRKQKSDRNFKTTTSRAHPRYGRKGYPG